MKRDFGAKAKKKITQAQLPNLRSQSRAHAPARSATRGFYFISPPSLNKMSKMYLMRSSPVTNEAVICQKGKSVNLELIR